MLYYRRKLLLAVLEVFGGSLSSKMLQKYLFLVTRGQEVKVYDFVPFKYGCFSFQAEQDLDALVKLGYLINTNVDSSDGYELIKKESMLTEIDMFDRQKIVMLRNDFASYSQNELIRFVYLKAP